MDLSATLKMTLCLYTLVYTIKKYRQFFVKLRCLWAILCLFVYTSVYKLRNNPQGK